MKINYKELNKLFCKQSGITQNKPWRAFIKGYSLGRISIACEIPSSLIPSEIVKKKK